MSIEQEIRDAIERNKAIREEVGQMNCTLSKLEHKYGQYMKAADEGYQKGYEDGKKSGYEKGLNAVGTYQKGRVIGYDEGFADGKNSIDKGCDGCEHKDKSGKEEPCKHCSNNFLNYYKPLPKDEICFGDEVVDKAGEKGIVVSRDNNDETIYVLFKEDQVPQIVYKSDYRKTGVHRDIDSYFEEI